MLDDQSWFDWFQTQLCFFIPRLKKFSRIQPAAAAPINNSKDFANPVSFLALFYWPLTIRCSFFLEKSNTSEKKERNFKKFVFFCWGIHNCDFKYRMGGPPHKAKHIATIVFMGPFFCYYYYFQITKAEKLNMKKKEINC